jgi:hypothetical protein
LKKYVFLGKYISYHLSLGYCFEKSRFHIVLGAFLGLIQKISSVFYDMKTAIYRKTPEVKLKVFVMLILSVFLDKNRPSTF